VIWWNYYWLLIVNLRNKNSIKLFLKHIVIIDIIDITDITDIIDILFF
jgi:hypothetical protein